MVLIDKKPQNPQFPIQMSKGDSLVWITDRVRDIYEVSYRVFILKQLLREKGTSYHENSSIETKIGSETEGIKGNKHGN